MIRKLILRISLIGVGVILGGFLILPTHLENGSSVVLVGIEMVCFSQLALLMEKESNQS